jgi:ribosome-associated protein
VIEIDGKVNIDENEIQFVFIRASGPGGQNVNKVSSAVQLRFDTSTPSLPEAVRSRLQQIARTRINQEGILIIEAKQYRTQEQNRQDALNRLIELIRRALEKPKPRKRTQPTLASRQKRVAQKRQRGEIKRMRRSPYEYEE